MRANHGDNPNVRHGTVQSLTCVECCSCLNERSNADADDAANNSIIESPNVIEKREIEKYGIH